MPTRGGAIQLAYFPASWRGFISVLMKAMSARWAATGRGRRSTRPRSAGGHVGPMRWPANSPMRRLKKAMARLGDAEVDAVLLDRLVPAVDAALAVGDVVVEQPALMARSAGTASSTNRPSTTRHDERVLQRWSSPVASLKRPPLAGAEVRFGAVAEISLPNGSRVTLMWKLALRWSSRSPRPARGSRSVSYGSRCRPFFIAAQVASTGAADAGLADEQVVRLLGEHEAAAARQRVEAALPARQLHLAVAVGEIGEHEERQPVGRALVEGAQDARVVVGRAAFQQRLGLFAAVCRSTSPSR